MKVKWVDVGLKNVLNWSQYIDTWLTFFVMRSLLDIFLSVRFSMYESLLFVGFSIVHSYHCFFRLWSDYFFLYDRFSIFSLNINLHPWLRLSKKFLCSAIYKKCRIRKYGYRSQFCDSSIMAKIIKTFNVFELSNTLLLQYMYLYIRHII